MELVEDPGADGIGGNPPPPNPPAFFDFQSWGVPKPPKPPGNSALAGIQGVIELPGQSFFSQYRYIYLSVVTAIVKFSPHGNAGDKLFRLF